MQMQNERHDTRGAPRLSLAIVTLGSSRLTARIREVCCYAIFVARMTRKISGNVGVSVGMSVGVV